MADRNQFNNLVDELGKFIHQWPWDLFVTLTFGARFPISYNYNESQWNRFLDHINKRQKRNPYWVSSLETGREQDVPHVHALIGGTELSPREIPEIWHPNTGNAQAEIYDPERRGAWYIAKNPESVEFSENLMPPPARNREE